MVGTGLMYYKARYYSLGSALRACLWADDPALGRFVSADTIVPGAASGAGGGVTTLGYSERTRLTPLTVNLSAFVLQINAENREVAQFGAFFQWEARTRREHNIPTGPRNPQALNRYTYVLNNPLRYVDPMGYWSSKLHLTAEECTQLIDVLDKAGDIELLLGILGTAVGLGQGILGLVYKEVGGFPGKITPESMALLSEAFPLLGLAASPPVIVAALAFGAVVGVDSAVTNRDFDKLHDALLEVQADSLGATISMSGVGIYRFSITSSHKKVSFNTALIGLLGSALPTLFQTYALLHSDKDYPIYLPYIAR